MVEAAPDSLRTIRPCADDAVDSARIIDYSASSVTIDVHSPCPGLLVLSDMYYPGWAATVNGTDARVYATDAALRGVPVRQGHSRVVFHYRPKPFRVGAVLFVAAIAAIMAIALLGFFSSRWWRERRRAALPESPLTEVTDEYARA